MTIPREIPCPRASVLAIHIGSKERHHREKVGEEKGDENGNEEGRFHYQQSTPAVQQLFEQRRSHVSGPVAKARQVLREILAGPLVLTTEDRAYRFEATRSSVM